MLSLTNNLAQHNQELTIQCHLPGAWTRVYPDPFRVEANAMIYMQLRGDR